LRQINEFSYISRLMSRSTTADNAGLRPPGAPQDPRGAAPSPVFDPLAAGVLAGFDPVDPLALRGVLGRYVTGVTIVTCRAPDGEPVGLTCNSFNALSLAPPLVLWSLRQVSPSLPAFREAAHFAINVLAESQVELSRRFASALPDKFAGDAAWRDGLGGAPVLTGAAAVLECERAAEHAAGDHCLFIGRVRRMADLATPPLLFHGGHYHMLGEIL
jgi:3-hydroxy-9,10-secoandrosta-1,3,5(10)-triene-9,17-dione monooxygenase reductase component